VRRATLRRGWSHVRGAALRRRRMLKVVMHRRTVLHLRRTIVPLDRSGRMPPTVRDRRMELPTRGASGDHAPTTERCRSFGGGDMRPAVVHRSPQVAVPCCKVDMLPLLGSRLEVMLVLSRELPRVGAGG
jgi:hypothetical protein